MRFYCSSFINGFNNIKDFQLMQKKKIGGMGELRIIQYK